MQILDELIASLPTESSSLTEALLKTKVLLHQLGRGDLAEWVTWELQGYPSVDVLPGYRTLHATVRGSVANGFERHTDTLLPVMHLPQEVRSRFESCKNTESISTLEKLASSDTDGLMIPIPLECHGYFQKKLSNGFYIDSAWSAIGYGKVGQVITQVRSRLLDFLLELQSKVDDTMTPKDVKALGQSQETEAMFKNAIFGDHATIMVGHGGIQVVVGVREGNVNSLIAALVEKGVPKADADELREAIESDSTSAEVAAKNYGPSVRAWIGRMMTKAASTSWNVELSIAANLVTDALKHYYGWF